MTDTALTHHGVKGMKWGVRKAYSDRLSGNAAIYGRVAAGKGSGIDKFRVTMSTPVTKIVTGRTKQHAATQERLVQEHLARINGGQTKVKDVLLVAHNLRLSDIGRGVLESNVTK